jgi:hypothetical protein
MTQPNLGSMPIDLAKLLETRMLVQANSGAGKSWTLRRILEQTAAGVQQLVIDPEGEFASLREKFDYIVCAPHGADAVATPQTATALARALWESGTSAILDIYELKAHERILFVRRFLESLINAPKSVWHPTLVAIDEIQMFAPQQGSAESLAAVIDLASRGRKRGLCLVAATQRLSKVHKDVAAETLNKIVMRTGLDVDVQRAADELGMARAGAAQTLRELEPGEAFVFGPALCRGVERTRIGPVATSHPKTGQRGMQAPPPASKAVLAKLAKIAGLQREAEEEVKTVASLSTELANVRRELTIAKKAQTGVPEAEVQRRIREAVAAVPKAQEHAPSPKQAKALHDIARLAAAALGGQAQVTIHAPSASTRTMAKAVAAAAPPAGQVASGVTAPQQRILDALARLAAFGIDSPAKATLAAMAGVSSKSSGYTNNLSAMRSRGLVDYPAGGLVALTHAGAAIANAPDKPATLADIHAGWLAMVTRPQATILRVLIDKYPAALAKAALADLAGVSAASSGYTNNLSAMRTMGALDYPSSGMVRAANILFPK